MKKTQQTSGDIHDSREDIEKMQAETVTIDMPEVKDIPGQENIKVPKMGEMADVTASSSDEEGEGILDDLNSEDGPDEEDDEDPEEEVVVNGQGNDDLLNGESNVSKEERDLLRRSGDHSSDIEDETLTRAALDETDDDGDLLNEAGNMRAMSGSDLDVPGSELDDDNEEIGEEDEQNNSYSNGDQD